MANHVIDTRTFDSSTIDIEANMFLSAAVETDSYLRLLTLIHPIHLFILHSWSYTLGFFPIGHHVFRTVYTRPLS